MKKLILFAGILMVAQNVKACEMLILAKDPPGELASDSVRKGDVFVVREDGFLWGYKELLMNYIVASLPDVSESDAKFYEEAKMDNSTLDENGNAIPRMVYPHKWRIDPALIDSAIMSGKNRIDITESDIQEKQ